MRRLFLLALALTILLPLLAVMLVFLAAAGESAAQCGAVFAGSSGPVGGVPAADIPIFQGAAAQFGLGARGPSILAAINYVESTFGQSNDAGVHSGANYAGAMGPMQFLQGTWDTYKVQAPGGAVPPNVYDEADAVYSAANYLKASGAPGDWPGAIFAYNHSSAYVQQVLSQAQSYYTQGLTAQGSATSTTTSGGGSAIAGSPFSVPPASGDPAGPITLAPGQPTIVAATYFTDHTGAWGDNLLVSHDSYAELSPGIPGSQVTRQNATMLGGLPYMTPLRVTNPQNGRSVILYKRDIGAGQPLSTHAGRLPLPDRPDRVGRPAARPAGLRAGAGHAADRPGQHARRRAGVLGQLGVRAGRLRDRSDPRVHDRPRRHGRRRERPGRHPDLRAAGQPARRSASATGTPGSRCCCSGS